MVAENKAFQAADRIRSRSASDGGRKERVSVRTVRKELGKGSFPDIARELAKWKEREAYRPAIEQANLPEAFERRLAVLGQELLELARVEAARAKLADFIGAEERQAGDRDVLDEALDRVDLLEERVAALQAEVDRLRTGAADETVGKSVVASEGPASAPPGRTGPGFADIAFGMKLAREANDFWGQVRAAVEGVIRRRGPLAVHPFSRRCPTGSSRTASGRAFRLRRRGCDTTCCGRCRTARD